MEVIAPCVKMYIVFVVLLVTIACAVAQTASLALSSSSSIATHTVAVGAAGHAFTPNTITAHVKDVVEFRFYPLNHSVARAGYKSPCIPYEYTGVNKVGFWSGFAPVNVILQNPPRFDIVINDTEPIFFYCSAPGSCLRERMIGVINPNSSQTLENQVAYVENSTFAFSPGEAYPAETTSPPASPTTLATPHATANVLSSGIVTSIVVGVLVFVASVIVLFVLYRRKQRRQSQNASKDPPQLYASPPPLQQYPKDYYSSHLPNSPSVADRMSPESYSHLRSLSPLISPFPSEMPPAMAQDSMCSNPALHSTLQYVKSPTFGNQHLHNVPQELAASESNRIDRNKLASLSGPLSLSDSLSGGRDSEMAKL